MGSYYSKVENLSNKYRDYSSGCATCNAKPGNPGTFDDFHKKVTDLYPHNFEGIRMIIKNNLSKNFNVSHTIAMSSLCPSGYKFGTYYEGTKKVNFHEKYPILRGSIMPNGNLSADFIHTLGCRYRMKVSAQIQDDVYKRLDLTGEYRSDESTFSISIHDPVLLKKEGILILRYLQALSSRMTIGAEIACNKSSKVPGGQLSNIAGAFRYSRGIDTLSATLGLAGVHICYHRRESQQLQLGVEFQSNFNFKESSAGILYQVDLPFADLVFKGFVNTQPSVGAVLEKKLYPIPEASLLLSGYLNYNKQTIRVGIGLNVEK